ncbi:uncharacterized protein LOC123526174 [Mercenaria mercenaria]|uniref:uncharacterized protein LOC123526174 n=1 Tax=Mercenaria mercenaria TaxID=6596 RepID=UPI00234F73A3|nr:uncharacterized protein LOC123526174 [Mercenaria mercenaria]
MVLNLCFLFILYVYIDKGFVAGEQQNNELHRMMERLEVLEKQQQDSLSKIKSLERTVRSQAKQIASQARDFKDFEFIVHRHRTRVQKAYERSRLNKNHIRYFREVLKAAGLLKKKKVGDKKSPHIAGDEHENESQNLLSVESNRPQATVATSNVNDRESIETDDRRHGTKHQRQARILRRTVVANERLAAGKRQGSEGIAFTVYLDHDVDFGAHQTIKFNQIITNEGNGYSPHSGVFTCPEGGMYMFSFFVGQNDETVPRGIVAELMVNSKNVLDAIVDSHSPGQDITGGNVAVIRLNQGDVVWVDSRFAGDHAEGSANLKLTSFSGVYLFP